MGVGADVAALLANERSAASADGAEEPCHCREAYLDRNEGGGCDKTETRMSCSPSELNDVNADLPLAEAPRSTVFVEEDGPVVFQEIPCHWKGRDAQRALQETER